jgi:hypothetical protein
MTLTAGSPCYPAWRTLIDRWRDYTGAWRVLAVPLSLPVLAASAPSGALAYGADAAPVTLSAVAGSGAGGRLLAGDGADAIVALAIMGSGSIDGAGSVAAALGVAPVADGRITASAGAEYVALLLSGASGGALRPTVTPPARLSRGRLTWRF